jgi:hypothetical protein
LKIVNQVNRLAALITSQRESDQVAALASEKRFDVKRLIGLDNEIHPMSLECLHVAIAR